MLNKNGERELAYIVAVDRVDPIPGYDRIDVATVNGWHCVVQKGMNPGDLAVYFEIDSLLPANDERFSFCEKYKYRVKTQRMCKGTVISQGLLMPIDQFPELAGCQVGDFVTEKLGVIYYEPEDNVRKAKPVDKYKKMANRHQKLFKKAPFRWLMKREWGKKLLFVFFGKKRDKRGGWPEWVVKTDEDRCLAGKTKIDTDKGKLTLSTIVNKRLPVKIKSVNLSNGKIEYKPIVSYQKYITKEPLLDIEFIQENDRDTKINRVVCTQDHKFYIDGEYVPAKNLKVSDRITRCYKTLPRESLDILYGTLLGDGCITFDKRHTNGRAKFSYTQHKNHEQYFELIRKTFGSPSIYLEKSGYTGENNILRFSFSDQLCSGTLDEIGVINDGHFSINDIFCNALTIRSIAVWYMDDGTLRNRDSNTQRATAEISSNSFSKEENELLIRTLVEVFGIGCSLKYNATRGYYSIYITADGTEKLSRMIAPFVPDCMRYKLTAEADKNYPFEEELWHKAERSDHLFTTKILSIKPFINHTNGYHVSGTVYDIEVADNHNFFANGVLTHNCQNVPWILKTNEPWIATEKIDGTSTTFTIKRGKTPKDNQFIVCSRNVAFDESDDDPCYYETNVYTEMAKKYNMKAVLEDLLMSHPDEEYITIQGETYGNGIQKRTYNKEEHDLAVFNLIFSSTGRMNTMDMINTLRGYGIPCVPVLGINITLPDNVDEVINMSSGVSIIDGEMREGIVFRSLDGKRSFKAVSNEYLLKYHG